MKTIFKPIPGHKGYRAGSDGTIWSAWQRKRSTNKKKPFLISVGKKWKQMKTTLRMGYPSVMLGSKTTPINVYRLILIAFKGKCPKGKMARHFDDNPLNNTPDNLAWGTRKENALDQIKNGRTSPGEKNPKSKIKDSDALKIRALRGKITQESIAQKFKIDQTTVSSIQLRKTWRHI